MLPLNFLALGKFTLFECNRSVQHTTLPEIPVVQINLAAKSLIGVLIWLFVDLEKEHTRVASKNTEIETRVCDFDSSNRNSQQQQKKMTGDLDLKTCRHSASREKSFWYGISDYRYVSLYYPTCQHETQFIFANLN